MRNLIRLIFTLVVLIPLPSLAKKIYIEVGKANVKKSLIALPPFHFYGANKTKKSLDLGQEIFSTVSNDLSVSGLFKFISQEAFLEDTSLVGLRPAPGAPNGFKFSNWQAIGAEFLIRGGFKIVANKISLEIYVYHVNEADLVFGKTYDAPIAAVRKLAHTFSNDLVKELTGKKSFFNSRIVVSYSPEKKRYKEIVVMDWDGYNRQQITNTKSTSIAPTWSPDGSKIAYTSFLYHRKYRSENVDLFLYDLNKKENRLLSWRKGLNSGAVFTPDGKFILATLSFNGSPDLYKIDLEGKIVQRITRGPNRAMNVEAAVSPDGRKIALSSDRSGSPMVWILNAVGGNANRITFAGKYNATPAWSPDGNLLAFAGQDEKFKHFDIFTVKPNKTAMKRLTSARKINGKMANNESPVFSPDGRHVMFVSDRSGTNQIYIVNLDGTNERRITFDKNNYYRPKWSWSDDGQ